MKEEDTGKLGFGGFSLTFCTRGFASVPPVASGPVCDTAVEKLRRLITPFTALLNTMRARRCTIPLPNEASRAGAKGSARN